MDKFIVDTNGFLRFLLNDIPEQAEEVNKLFIKAKTTKIEIFVPHTTPYLKIQDGDIFQETLEIFSEKNIDFVDCFLASYAKLKNMSLFTFDRTLQKI